jgi:tripartite ATP-independent transporter DctP family solute receptor
MYVYFHLFATQKSHFYGLFRQICLYYVLNSRIRPETKTGSYMMRIALLSIGCTLSLLFLISCSTSESDAPKTIILAHAMHPTHPVSIAMERMAENVENYSNGQMKILIYPQGQLGGERTLLELVQIGTIGIAKVTTARLENIVPSMQVFSLPYLFRDKEHVFNALDGDVGRELLLEGAEHNLLGIGYYDAGSRSFYTKNRPIHTPADLAGLKIRVIESVIAMRLMRTLNGAPTPISWGELYTAFQGGVVDGAENNPPSYYTSRHYEVCRYYSLNEHTTIPDILVMNAKLWESLTDQQRQWLQDAVDESVEFQRILWRESELESLQRVEEDGVTITYPDKDVFRRAVQPVYDHVERNNPELYTWVERIRLVE